MVPSVLRVCLGRASLGSTAASATYPTAVTHPERRAGVPVAQRLIDDIGYPLD
jgi:hypothetical protein